MNFWKRHIGDYLKRTLSLTMAQDGAYGRLLDLAYDTERPLSSDLDELCNEVRCRNSDERKAVAFVLSKYFVLTEAGYVHSRVLEEVAKAQAQAEKNRAIAVAREEQKRAMNAARIEHEACTNEARSVHAACESREPSQTPDSRLKQEQELRASETVPVSAPSGAKIPAQVSSGDPAKDLFDLGVKVLMDKGVKEGHARSQIAKLKHEFGVEFARSVIDGIVSQGVTEPKSWIAASAEAERKRRVAADNPLAWMDQMVIL